VTAGTLAQLHEPVRHQSKHVDVQHHFLQQHIKWREIKVDYTSSEVMVANVLTTARDEPQHDKFCMAIGLKGV
jgi:hypothetical protein